MRGPRTYGFNSFGMFDLDAQGLPGHVAVDRVLVRFPRVVASKKLRFLDGARSALGVVDRLTAFSVFYPALELVAFQELCSDLGGPVGRTDRISEFLLVHGVQ